MEEFQVLLIWEYVPENTSIYYLRVKKPVLEKMKRCHGNLINEIELTEQQEKDLNWLYELTLKIEPIYSTMVNPNSPAYNSLLREEEDIAHNGSEAIPRSDDDDLPCNPIPEALRQLRTRKDIEIDTTDINTVNIIYSGFIM